MAKPGTDKDGTVFDAERGIPDATVARLPVYLRALSTLAEDGVITVSSEDLAEVAGVNSSKLRKDLSYLGSYGTRGVGYEVKVLVEQISENLGLSQDWNVAIFGAGNLGTALAQYSGFASRGFTVVAMFDADEAIVGTTVSGVLVRSIDDLETVIDQTGAHLAVLAVPGPVAQEICDRAVAAGIRGILNFAPSVLQVPDWVQLRKVDLSIELQILAFHAQRAAADELVMAKELS
ncbi:redox-sensing transcriptional repressor Rex [Saxibacter everestensis]|uniref:Redox-sensing transcriptional repressor Rex n=1 Tax=Saxibacter everestensis TaxID=2909229 RepID=A0ABY8QYS7_9MICO|nr:redox-sensing transcriptional repressor Rex [Brevibacteriaceae bacterium ZFBP1038]